MDDVDRSWGFTFALESDNTPEACAKRREDAERKRKELEQELLTSEDMEEIHCDVCGGFICQTLACDLNGSYFVCGTCRKP